MGSLLRPSASEVATEDTAESRANLALLRIARVAATCINVPYAQVIRFGGGDGIAAPPVAYGQLADSTPDLRLVCAALPTAAELVLVEDSAKDARIGRGLPAEARFFALARIETPRGRPLGALCLVDVRPRQLTSSETDCLVDFAALAAGAMEDQGPEQVPDESEELMASLLAALGEAVYCPLFVTKDGIVISANDLAAALIGIDDAERLLGRHVTDLVPEEQIEKVKAQLSVSGRYEVDVVHALGHTLRVEVQAVSMQRESHTLRIAAFRLVADEA